MDGVRSRWHLNPFVPNNSFGILYGYVCVDDEAVGRRTSNWFFGDMVKRRKSMRQKEGNEQKKTRAKSITKDWFKLTLYTFSLSSFLFLSST